MGLGWMVGTSEVGGSDEHITIAALPDPKEGVKHKSGPRDSPSQAARDVGEDST